ncbi:MAG: DUF3185 family protein [Planctomycetes bacterium]|nr:DUF3185 family protein [Planctomycetota bacterium]
MGTGRIVGLALLIVGAGLIFYGIEAGDSLSSRFSRFFQGAPSDKSIWMLIVGVLCAVIGIAKLASSRRAA